MLNEIFRDKIIFLKPLGDSFQTIGKKYFNPNAEKVRYNKKTYPIPKKPSALNKYGKRIYFIEFTTTKLITFSQAKKGGVTFTAEDMDLILTRGLFNKIVQSLTKGSMAKDQIMMLILTAIAAGSLGFVGALAVLGAI